MCWHCNKNEFHIQIAEKDTEVYKMLTKDKEDNLVSVVFSQFPWQQGFLYKASLDIKLTWYMGDYEFQGKQGFHSYIRKPIYHPILGAYSYDLKFRPCTVYPSGCYLVKCVIPKGYSYCVNESGEVISDALKFIEIINEQYEYSGF